MEKLQLDDQIEIIQVCGHYEGRVNGKFIVSGDTWTEVKNELSEMRYL